MADETESSCPRAGKNESGAGFTINDRDLSKDMQQYRDDAAQEWLNGLYGQTRCRWCLHPYMKLKARGLCSPCYRIAREFFNRYERATGTRDVALHSHKLQYVAEVAAMIDDAKQEAADMVIFIH